MEKGSGTVSGEHDVKEAWGAPDHFGTTKLRRQKSPFGCEYRISAMKVPGPQCVKEKTPWRAFAGVRWPYRSAYRCSKRFMLA